jgi:dihydrolipoamide dehydrogenase
MGGMTINYAQIPVTVFSHPEVASIGLTEEAALTNQLEFNVLKSAYAANAKAVIVGEREGFVKIITDKNTDKILGVHIIGWQASELIHQAVAALSQGVSVAGWRSMIWSHPVLSEVLKSALSAS